MTTARRALVTSALGAGVSYSNLAVALPLLVLAERGSSFLAGALIGTNTVAFSLGALFVAGTATGGALTGAAIALARAAGVSSATSIRLSFLLGLTGALAALPSA